MTRNRTFAAVVAALVLPLAGCPLPQPLPDYPPGTTTPPRILVDQIKVNGAIEPLTVIPVPMNCSPAPSYALDVTLHDDVALGAVARWFVDYRPVQGAYEAKREDAIAPPASTTERTEVVPTYTFLPYEPNSPVANDVRVVEIVVSTRFSPDPTAGELPYKTPDTGYETAVYRWIFRFSADAPCPSAP